MIVIYVWNQFRHSTSRQCAELAMSRIMLQRIHGCTVHILLMLNCSFSKAWDTHKLSFLLFLHYGTSSQWILRSCSNSSIEIKLKKMKPNKIHFIRQMMSNSDYYRDESIHHPIRKQQARYTSDQSNRMKLTKHPPTLVIIVNPLTRRIEPHK